MFQNSGSYLSAIEKEEIVDNIIQDLFTSIPVEHVSDRGDDKVKFENQKKEKLLNIVATTSKKQN